MVSGFWFKYMVADSGGKSAALIKKQIFWQKDKVTFYVNLAERTDDESVTEQCEETTFVQFSAQRKRPC